MDREKIIKSMRDAIEANKHIREQTNNALSHGIGLLEKHDGEYKRGLEAGWKLATDVIYMSTDDRFHAFGCKSINLALKHHTGSDALKLYNEYLGERKKKEEEAAKPKFGDVVEVISNNDGFVEKGIFLSECFNTIKYLNGDGIVEAWTDVFKVIKTGEHVDIQGMLDKINE